MTLALTVRSVRRSDFDQWLPLWEGYNAFYGRSGATALAAEITRTTWARFFDDYEPVHALVAESEGRLSGLAHYLFHRSTILLAPTCYLQDLFTDVAQRGKGVGRALINAVYDEARRRQQPCLLAHARVQPDRAPTLRPAGRRLRLRRLPQAGISKPSFPPPSLASNPCFAFAISRRLSIVDTPD